MAFQKLREAVSRRSQHFLLSHDILEPHLTTQSIIGLMGNNELLEKTMIVLKEHNLMRTETFPASDASPGDQQRCILANQLGGQISLESILDMGYLSPTERLLTVEFMERFDRGDYPQFIRQEDLPRSHEIVHGHTTGTTD